MAAARRGGLAGEAGEVKARLRTVRTTPGADDAAAGASSADAGAGSAAGTGDAAVQRASPGRAACSSAPSSSDSSSPSS
ncbi:MAG: hypothetical protein GY822_02770 [Deltaproteobacteria bacterium]|nr:hypothetical protein [Deltaproteobacteria bacterium]